MVQKIKDIDSKSMKPVESKKSGKEKQEPKNFKLKTEREIATDFAAKVYKRFDKIIKSIILFGSTAKQTNVPGSDIDIIIVVDDSTVRFNDEMIVWYREELGKIVQQNPYKKELHINTVRLTTWWNDLQRGDPVVINILRYGEPLLDFGGFFTPLKILLQEGRIRSTPEAIYIALERVPAHILRSKNSELGAIEGVYWAFVDSAHALLMAIKISPPSPEHIPSLLTENFVNKKLLRTRYVDWYRDLFDVHRRIVHGEIRNLPGHIIDEWQVRAEEFFKEVLKLINQLIS